MAWRLGQARPARWAGHLAARTNGLRSARPHFPAAPGWDRAAESVQTPKGTEGGGAVRQRMRGMFSLEGEAGVLSRQPPTAGAVTLSKPVT